MSEKRDLMKRAGWCVYQHKTHVGILWGFKGPGGITGDSHMETEERAWAVAEADFEAAILRSRALLAHVDGPRVPLMLGDRLVGEVAPDAASMLNVHTDMSAIGFKAGAR